MNDAIRRAERAEASAARELAGVPEWIWDGQSLPVPIDFIAEDHYGLLVQARPSLVEFATSTYVHVSGVLLRSHGRILVDALEAARAPGRRRFTIAHELGHLVLHDDRVRPRVGRLMPRLSADSAGRRGSVYPAALAYPPEELEANQFAAAMLMPDRVLQAAGVECPIAVAELCGVSVVAAEKRLEYLHWREAGAQSSSARDARCRAVHGHDYAGGGATITQWLRARDSPT